jgi:hypothetical protein
MTCGRWTCATRQNICIEKHARVHAAINKIFIEEGIYKLIL